MVFFAVRFLYKRFNERKKNYECHITITFIPLFLNSVERYEGYRERTRKVQKCKTENIEKASLKLRATEIMKFE